MFNYYGDDDDLYLDPEVEDQEADEDQEAALTAAERNPSLR